MTRRDKLLFSRASIHGPRTPGFCPKMIWEPERLQRSPGMRTQPKLPAVPRCSSITAEGLIVGEDPGAEGTEGERAHRLDVLQVRFTETVDQALWPPRSCGWRDQVYSKIKWAKELRIHGELFRLKSSFKTTHSRGPTTREILCSSRPLERPSPP